MRVVGPNSFGLINNDPDGAAQRLARPDPAAAPAGSACSPRAARSASRCSRRPPGATSASRSSPRAGNRVDVSGNDFMQYWIDDDDTTAVGLYLESMGNPRKFSRIARDLAPIKPVIVVKSGVSRFGVPPGHRAAPTNVPPEAFDAMLRQAGVIRVENVHQLFDVAQLVVHQPLPAGDRVAVVGNSDALGRAHRRAPASAGASRSRTARSSLPAEADGRAVRARRSPRPSPTPRSTASLTCFIPPLVTHDEEVAAAVRDAADGSEKPCAATFLGMRGVDDGARTGDEHGRRRRAPCPAYAMPEDAVRALAAATRYGAVAGQATAARRSPPPASTARVAEASSHAVLAGDPEGRRLTRDEVARAAAGLRHRRLGQRRGAHRPTRRWPRPSESGYPVVLKSTVAGAAPPGRARRRARRPRAAEARCATRAQSLTERLGPAGRRPLRRAEDGHPRRARASSAATRTRCSGPVVELQRRRAADRAARRHRPPHPAAHRRRRHRPDLVGQGGARCCTATAAPRRCTGPPSPTSSPGCRCSPTTSPRWPRWSSTRSTPSPAGSTCSAPRSWSRRSAPGHPGRRSLT